MRKENSMPLVTVAVITYNSSEFIIEALESIKKQTYKNIELIVSDDCSKDETVDICRMWIDNNKGCFTCTQLITATRNTGIVGNGNRAISASNGEWIKLVAGDDLLFPDAIEAYLNFVLSNDKIKCCFGRCVAFSGPLTDAVYGENKLYLENIMFGKSSSAKRQYRILTHVYAGSGGTAFYNKAIFDKVGAFDERFPLQEDHAFFIKVTKAGYKFHLLKKNTVYYRIHQKSVTHLGGEGKIFSPQHIRYIKQYRYEYCMENLSGIGKLMLRYSLWIKGKVIDSGNSISSGKARLYWQICRITDPVSWITRFLGFATNFYKLD